MQEKNRVTLNYFEDKNRFADLLNGYIFQGESVVNADDIHERKQEIPVLREKENGWDYPMLLLEVRKYKNIENFQSDIQQIFGFLQNASDRKNLNQYIEDNSDVFEHLSKDAYELLQEMSHSKELKMIKKDYQTQEGDVNMCQAIREMIEDGEARGEERGFLRGINFWRMYMEGAPLEEIAAKYEMQVKEVKKLISID